jgi:glycosyltransferase involved in cell wall biosynthesis
MPLLLDLTHTCHTLARTGIQRVARSLHAALGAEGTAVTHDPYLRGWRPLEPWEQANLAATAATHRRGARWPWSARLRGRAQRVLGSTRTTAAPPNASGAIFPEVFSPAVAAALPSLFARVNGPRVALFHDAIALKFPELTPTKTVARFPAYLQELLAFDGIAAISEESRDSLRDYWHWLGVASPPPIETIPLATDPAPPVATGPVTGARPVVLSVGSIEGRKNHRVLLEACEQLWAEGAQFELHLIGLAHPQTGRAALDRIRALQAAGRPLRYDGPVDDGALEAAYAACAFTVYPSLIEGFGLPVIESVARGKPCLCSARGAIGESARGGGCVALETLDAAHLSRAIDRLLRHPPELAALASAARQRSFRRWPDYARELLAWMKTLHLRR